MTAVRPDDTAAKRHQHSFTALWQTFGPYGRQDVHYHPCVVEGCSRALVADGRRCGGESQEHKRVTL